jgi:hypothetical protein
MLKAVPALSSNKLPSVATIRVQVNKMLSRIRAAHESGQHSKARHLTQLHLGTFNARYLAVWEAYKKMRKDIRPKTSMLPGVARSLNPRAGTQEKVLVKILKKNGNPDCAEPFLEFGLENSALQELVLSVLKAHANLNPNQYLLQGVPAAIKKVARLFGDGLECAIETDITDCFHSFDAEKVLELLPIPKEVTRHVLLCGTYRLELGTTMFGPADSAAEDDQLINAMFPGARQGIPQGSPASPRVAEMLLTPLFDNLPQLGVTVGYGGKFLVMSEALSDAMTITSALRSALKACPGGQIRPNQPRVFAPGEPIEFLGHCLRRSNGTVRIDPSSDILNEFQNVLHGGLSAITKLPLKDVAKKRAQGVRLERYVRSWNSAFKMCTDIDTLRDGSLKRIAMAI